MIGVFVKHQVMMCGCAKNVVFLEKLVQVVCTYISRIKLCKQDGGG